MLRVNFPCQASEHIKAPIPTYAGDNVLMVPVRPGTNDETLIREVSRRVEQSLIHGDSYRGAQRDKKVIEEMKEIRIL